MRTVAVLTLAVALTGCGIVDQMQRTTNRAPAPPPPTVRPADLQAWQGAPLLDLETHPFFSVVPRTVTPLSDGRALWNYADCVGQICCHNQFFVAGPAVQAYRTVGRCYTDCSLRPSSRPCPPAELVAEVQAARARAQAAQAQAQADTDVAESSRRWARLAVAFGAHDDATRERAGLAPLTPDERHELELAEQRKQFDEQQRLDERRHQELLEEARKQRQTELDCRPNGLGGVRCVTQ